MQPLYSSATDKCFATIFIYISQIKLRNAWTDVIPHHLYVYIIVIVSYTIHIRVVSLLTQLRFAILLPAHTYTISHELPAM